jgi:hypothetical protein
MIVARDRTAWIAVINRSRGQVRSKASVLVGAHCLAVRSVKARWFSNIVAGLAAKPGGVSDNLSLPGGLLYRGNLCTPTA